MLLVRVPPSLSRYHNGLIPGRASPLRSFLIVLKSLEFLGRGWVEHQFYTKSDRYRWGNRSLGETIVPGLPESVTVSRTGFAPLPPEFPPQDSPPLPRSEPVPIVPLPPHPSWQTEALAPGTHRERFPGLTAILAPSPQIVNPSLRG